MQMTLDLYYNGRQIISYKKWTWWTTGFNSNFQNKKAKNLVAVFTVRFKNEAMFRAFKRENRGKWTFTNSTLTAKLRF